MPLHRYAELRRTAPVWWNEQAPGTAGFSHGGLWVLSKHKHIKAVSKDAELWSSNLKGTCPIAKPPRDGSWPTRWAYDR